VLAEAAKVVQSSQDPASRAYTLATITKAQAWAGDREGAFTSARQAAAAALQLDPYTQCSALIEIAWARSVAGDREGALNVLRLAMKSAEALGKDDWRELGLLRWIATSRFDLGDRHAAMATTGKMSEIALAKPDQGSNRAAYLSDVVLAQTYVGEFDGAFRTVATASVDGQYIQGQLFGVMATAAAAEYAFYHQPHKTLGSDDRKLRLQALQQIIKSVESFECTGEKPYASLAIALAKLGDQESALRLAHKIGNGPLKHAHTFDPSVPPWVLSVIGAEQAKSGHVDQACATLREAVDLLLRAPELSSRRHLVEIASNQALVGEFVGALKTAEAVDPEQSVRTLVDIAEKERESGDQKGAHATLQIALEKAGLQLHTPPEPSQPEGVATKATVANGEGKSVRVSRLDLTRRWMDMQLRQIAAIHAKLGDLKAAVETLNLITREDDKKTAAGQIAEARAKAGDFEGAFTWALSLEPATVRVSALAGLAHGTLIRP